MSTLLSQVLRGAASLLASFLVLTVLAMPAHAESRVLYVAPGASDSNPGTLEEPFGTLNHALGELRAGDTLYVRGGTYRERVRQAMPNGSASATTHVVAMPGERAVVEGLLWLRDGSHWVIDGIEVTWDPATGAANEHMVKVTNGTDWVVRHAEIHGAQSFAGMLVASSKVGEPARWELRDSCLHETVPTNGTNQDHNLYINSGLSAGSGLIEGNVFFRAPNGENIKMGPPRDNGGTANVVVRHNTLFDAAQNVLISGESRDNVIERNIIAGAAGNYGNVRGYKITGQNNVAKENVGYDASSFILNYKGGNGVEDGGGNRFPLNPGFDRTGTCDGFVPSAPGMDGYGHLAAAPSDDSPPPPVDEATDHDSPAEKEQPKRDADEPRVSGGFKDVDDSNVHATAITELHADGIIQGVDEHHFAPRRSVTRAQLATMMVGLRAHLDAPLPIPPSSPFVDARGLPHGPNIAALADRGIVLGRTPTTFDPGASLTRAQLASILVRSYEDLGGELPAPARGLFADVGGSVHEVAIGRVGALGLVHGVDGRHYRPDQPVSREQLASVLHRFRGVVADD